MRTMDILIIIDMQNDFIEGVLGSNEAKIAVDKMCQYLENFKGKIILTQDTHDDFYKNSLEGKKLPVEHCQIDTWGWEINDNIKSRIYKKGLELISVKDEITLENIYKQEDKALIFTKNAFGSKLLIKYLQMVDNILNTGEKIERIVIGGLCTDICVITNVLSIKTFLPEVNIQLLVEATAASSKVNQNAALDIMRACQIDFI